MTELGSLISEKLSAREARPERVTDRARLHETAPPASLADGAETDNAGLTVAKSLHHRGQAFSSFGRYDEAEEFYRQALELYEKAAGIADPRTQEFIDDYAKFLVKTGQPDKAHKLRERAAQPASVPDAKKAE